MSNILRDTSEFDGFVMGMRPIIIDSSEPVDHKDLVAGPEPGYRMIRPAVAAVVALECLPADTDN